MSSLRYRVLLIFILGLCLWWVYAWNIMWREGRKRPTLRRQRPTLRLQRPTLRQPMNLSKIDRHPSSIKLIHQPSLSPVRSKVVLVMHDNVSSTKQPWSYMNQRRDCDVIHQVTYCLPNVFIIGSFKTGTQSLWDNLKQHPSMVTNNKDTPEHCWISDRQSANIQRYMSHFPITSLDNTVHVGVSCPGYLSSPSHMYLMKRVLPQTRLVVMLRNPVERFVSMFNFRVRLRMDGFSGSERVDDFVQCTLRTNTQTFVHPPSYWQRGTPEPPDFWSPSDVVDCTSHHAPTRAYLYQGMYALQLEQWFKHIPPSTQYVIGRSEDFFTQSDRFLRELWTWLGLPEDPDHNITKRNQKGMCSVEQCRRQSRQGASVDPETKIRVQAEAEQRRIKRLGKKQPPNPCGTASRCRAHGGQWLPSKLIVSAQLTQNLIQFYRPHNRRLYALLQHDMGWEQEILNKKPNTLGDLIFKDEDALSGQRRHKYSI